MGGSDFYCAVSGARYFNGESDVQDEIMECIQNGDFSDCELEEEIIMNGIDDLIPREVLDGLRYSEEDVNASNDFVFICPYMVSDSGLITLQAEFDDPRPAKPSEDNITEVLDVVTGQHPDLGGYQSKDGLQDFCVYNCCIITYSAYLILKQAAPAVKAYTIYALRTGDEVSQGNLPGIDYGPVNKLFEQYVPWAYVCDLPEGEDYTKAATVWLTLLSQKDKSVKEILREAWGHPGNLWTLVRPDRFPIAECMKLSPLPTFATNEVIIQQAMGRPKLGALAPDVILHICEFLPVKSIFAMMSVCRQFRTQILPHANPILYRRLLDDEPWLLPAGPFKLKNPLRGREEVDWWMAEWTKAGLTGNFQELAGKIPWLLYRRACINSYSMRNRKRIWGISKQIEQRALEKILI